MRTCPRCQRQGCGLPSISRFIHWTPVDNRGIQHDIPIVIGQGKIMVPHIPSLDCVCEPVYAELLFEGITTEGFPVEASSRYAFHCLAVPVFDKPGE